jgi:hypothetical protein
MDFISAAQALGISKRGDVHNDDSFVDRLNHKYTVVIIVIFTIVISASQYCGNTYFVLFVLHNFNKVILRVFFYRSTYQLLGSR